MRYYAAPMEGVTSYLYRKAHSRYFKKADKYFMPFLSPSHDHIFTKKDLREIAPEHNEGLNAVPQLLTRRAEDFLWAAGELKKMGYREVNLNLGCPSGTVTAKGKGAGFLGEPAELDRFLEEIFAAAEVRISVKTRLGLRESEEFSHLLEIYNRYPIAELTIHPRVRADFYRNRIRTEAFEAALPKSRNPVCYNGDLVTAAECRAAEARFQTAAGLMLGRGLIADPALIDKAGGGPGADKDRLRAFHDELYQGYCAAFGSSRNAMLRMKEIWFYLMGIFEDDGRYAKRLRKAGDVREYECQVAAVFRDLALRADAAAVWRKSDT